MMKKVAKSNIGAGGLKFGIFVVTFLNGPLWVGVPLQSVKFLFTSLLKGKR